MATFEYKLNENDTLQIGGTTNAVSIPGTMAITKSISGFVTQTMEEVTTTGTSDVVDPAIQISKVTTGGAHTVTLADGTYTGQIKEIILIVDGGNMTLTPANFADGTSLTFADALDYAKLRWSGTDWDLVGGSGLAIV